MIGKKVLLLSVCLCAIAVITQGRADNYEQIYKSEDVVCKNNYCTDKDKKPINGYVLKYNNGVIVRKYPFRDGYLEGLAKSYYTTGELETARNYIHGKLNGQLISFDKKGNITKKQTFKDGILDGITTINNDNTITKIMYKQGKKNGPTKLWQIEKDTVRIETEKYGKKGEEKTTIKNIALLYDITFNNDKLVKGSIHHYATDDVRCQSDQNKEKLQCDKDNSQTKSVKGCCELAPQTTSINNPLLFEAISYDIIEMKESMDCLENMLQENIEWNDEKLKKDKEKYDWLLKNYLNMEKELANMTTNEEIKNIYRERAKNFIRIYQKDKIKNKETQKVLEQKTK